MLASRFTTGLAAALLICGCAQRTAPRGGSERGSAQPTPIMHVSVTPDALEPALAAPAHGKWRLAPRSELEHVVLFLSHILIRHRDAEPSDVPFAPPGWRVQPPPPSRTRGEALALAQSVAAQAQANPSAFGQLARRYSEDTITAELAGSLGGVPASQLVSYPNVLDALSNFPAGSVSGVLETPYGFHVLLRRALPPEQIIDARRIVIGHDQAPWLGDYQRRAAHTSPRSRAEALELARGLAEQARAHSERFGALVEKFSEHADAGSGGDIGQWSNREPSPLRRQLERLSGLAVGEVTGPIETAMGVEILQRTASQPRTRYTMAAIKLKFQPQATPDRAEHINRVLATAQSLLAFLQRQGPATFTDLQVQYGSSVTESWPSGRGDRALSTALDSVTTGALLDRPFVVENNVLLVRKLAPEPPAPTQLELPAPELPDLEYLVRSNAAPKIAGFVNAIVDPLSRDLQLEGDKRRGFQAAHARFADALHQLRPDERVAGLHTTLRTLRDVLGEHDFQRYLAQVNGRVTSVLMR